jgi:hypothetical protein
MFEERRRKISVPGPDREADEIGASAQARVLPASTSLATHPISNNVLLFSLLLLLTASESFLSRQSLIPTSYHSPHLPP